MTGPVPPYTNPPINERNFRPRVFRISNLLIGRETLVETLEDHDYVLGQECRLLIPKFFGSTQLDHTTGFVIAIPSPKEVVLNIDSSQNVNDFIPNPPYSVNTPEILAIGSNNSGNISYDGVTVQPSIPGAFMNISR